MNLRGCQVPTIYIPGETDADDGNKSFFAELNW